MQISILIPTYNNLNYLKFTIDSIIKNSNFDHQLLVHINDGSDGSLDYIKNLDIQFTRSDKNIGLCNSINQLSKHIINDYVMYSHDDMYFCKNWDLYIKKEISKYKDELFYLTGTNVSVNRGLINYSCGNNPETFDETKFEKFCEYDNTPDLQGSHWAPHIIHRKIWNEVGGFSEEFNPGDGSDPDLCMKLWNKGIRIFKTISRFKVYHFSSVTTRKRHIKLNNGTKTFLLKYGFNPRYFRKYYLKGNELRAFDGPLDEPKISMKMLFDLIINRLKFFYSKIL